MKKNLVILVIVFLQCIALNAQYVVKNPTELEQLKGLPLEKIFMHYNTSVLLPGEYVFYSLYCINAQTNKLSNISRLAYIELVGEDNKSHIIQKVRLEQGRGQGDFFIPVSLPSGNYKLIGYTQWMKNAGQEQLFSDDVVIINPYRSDQNAIFSDDKASVISSDSPSNLEVSNTLGKKDDGTIVLLTDKVSYRQREKVSLTPRNYKGPLGHGSYSISVRKIDMLTRQSPMDAMDYSNRFLSVDKFINKTVNDSIILPEQRGELFFGKVITKKDSSPLADITVVISIPGTNFQLKSAITDIEGNFYTYIKKEYDATKILAQVPFSNSETYTITLSKNSGYNYKGKNFGDYSIDARFKEAILKRSIHNQIENGYYGFKPDSVLALSKKDPFDGGVPEVFILDDYTRFNTLQETLVEIIENVWVKKLEDNSYTFWVKEDNASYDDSFASDPPLVVVDGVFIPNHNELLNFNARTIKKIKILRDPLVMGSKKYHGLVAIETLTGDYLPRYADANVAMLSLEAPTLKKNYFVQRYSPLDQEKFKRIPDFRYQLFWEPNVTIKDTLVAYDFYTSDVPGAYEIVLDGFTTYGKPISVRKIIQVE